MKFDPAEIRIMIRMATKRTGTPIHDEDLEQEAALRAIEAFNRLGEIRHPRALLMKIVCDTVSDHWRRRRSSQEIGSIEERLISQCPTFEYDLDVRRQVELLQKALQRLSPGKRAIIELFYAHDYSIPDIAQLQGRSVSSVKMELFRSRHSLARIVRSLARNKSR